MTARDTRVFRQSARDGWLVLACLAHVAWSAGWLSSVTSMWGYALGAFSFALGVCWVSNTTSHNHLHRPLFTRRPLNRALSLLLTLAVAVPQSLWRAKHLWHHAGEPARGYRVPRAAAFEVAVIAALWLALLALRPSAFLFAYLPGYLLGLALCSVQGHYEHALADRPERGVSTYGRLYNLLWFNDGYHVEHHRYPSQHWTRLPALRVYGPESSLCPQLRFMQRGLSALAALRGSVPQLRARVLGWLERVALASPLLQELMLSCHARAFARLLSALDRAPRRVVIVGGGLFPRTLLVLSRLLPDAQLIVVDGSDVSVDRAKQYLSQRAPHLAAATQFVVSLFRAEHAQGADLVVTPLALLGNSRALVRLGVPLMTHDWIFQSDGDRSAVVSWLLLKKLTLHGVPSAAPEELKMTIRSIPPHCAKRLGQDESPISHAA
jgi:hypothetical protein